MTKEIIINCLHKALHINWKKSYIKRLKSKDKEIANDIERFLTEFNLKKWIPELDRKFYERLIKDFQKYLLDKYTK